MIQLDIRSRTNNPTPTHRVVRNPTPTPPKNLRLLTTPTQKTLDGAAQQLEPVPPSHEK